jgi:hypothetical protein
MKNKKILLSLILILVPGSGIIYGSHLLYKILKKKPRTYQDFLKELRKEAGLENKNNTSGSF